MPGGACRKSEGGAGATSTASTSASTLQSISGLSVQTSFWADPNSPTLRTFISFTNAGAGGLVVPVSWQSNVGSDAATVVVATSSGDTLYTTADRWLVTDNASDSDVPAVTHVLWGAGATVTPTLAGLSVFADGGGATQGVRADYSLSVAPGQTVALLFYNRIHEVRTDATASVGDFNGGATGLSAASLLAGLSGDQLGQVVNWNVAIPEPGALPLLVLGLAALGGWRTRRGLAHPSPSD